MYSYSRLRKPMELYCGVSVSVSLGMVGSIMSACSAWNRQLPSPCVRLTLNRVVNVSESASIASYDGCSHGKIVSVDSADRFGSMLSNLTYEKRLIDLSSR